MIMKSLLTSLIIACNVMCGAYAQSNPTKYDLKIEVGQNFGNSKRSVYLRAEKLDDRETNEHGLYTDMVFGVYDFDSAQKTHRPCKYDQKLGVIIASYDHIKHCMCLLDIAFLQQMMGNKKMEEALQTFMGIFRSDLRKDVPFDAYTIIYVPEVSDISVYKNIGFQKSERTHPYHNAELKCPRKTLLTLKVGDIHHTDESVYLKYVDPHKNKNDKVDFRKFSKHPVVWHIFKYTEHGATHSHDACVGRIYADILNSDDEKNAYDLYIHLIEIERQHRFQGYGTAGIKSLIELTHKTVESGMRVKNMYSIVDSVDQKKWYESLIKLGFCKSEHTDDERAIVNRIKNIHPAAQNFKYIVMQAEPL